MAPPVRSRRASRAAPNPEPGAVVDPQRCCRNVLVRRSAVYRGEMANTSEPRATRSRHVSEVIHRPTAQVYEFLADPENLPRWAAGLAQSEVARHGDMLIADSPMGRVTVRFAERNRYGVLDHDVTLPSGTTVNNPMRVLTHPNGAEVLFTVRQIELSDEEFERDVQLVAADLSRLKAILEQHA